MTSADYLTKIEEYKKIKKQVEDLNGYISDCENVLEKANKYASEIIIDKKTIDNGNLSTISSKVKKIPETMQIIINECNTKIEKYQELYNQLFTEETEIRASNKKIEINEIN